ncbi:MAG: hypothetical protein PHF86_00105 [Candidatus Nanoarchaeia archaeon]|nr:hypothetical protein [Candidatus Nanoarchaeia archaeon]
MRKAEYIRFLVIKNKKDRKKIELLKSLPEFIKLNGKGCAMRLDIEEMQYWRDAGIWGLPFRFRNSILVGKATYPEIKHLSGIMLVECSYEEWKEDNGRYAPNLNKKNNDEIDYENNEIDNLPF